MVVASFYPEAHRLLEDQRLVYLQHAIVSKLWCECEHVLKCAFGGGGAGGGGSTPLLKFSNVHIRYTHKKSMTVGPTISFDRLANGCSPILSDFPKNTVS